MARSEVAECAFDGTGCAAAAASGNSVDLASGDADGDGPMACLGAGTGLGEVYLTPNLGAEGLGYTAWPTEGGHVDLAPRDDEEADLLAWLKARVTGGGRVSVERVCSGPGVAHAYAPRRAARRGPRRRRGGNAALKWNPTSGLFLAGGVCVDENNRRLFRDDGPLMAAYRTAARVAVPRRHPRAARHGEGPRPPRREALATSILASANRKAPS
ncbi:dihydrolipoyllysine-residue succinyltransferase [Aureococcus anophagefferens]|nr:dihydrolipoyllysine-residue succinyltransferase [Aureococcus anophagefferens]